jgi:hypothetical protein
MTDIDLFASSSKKLYPVNEVKTGYQYYMHLLTEKALSLYKYTDLPESLPAEQIEMRLILQGYAVIFKHKKYGIVTCSGGVSGVDQYYLPTDFVYAQPALGSGNLKINKDCIIIWNTTADKYNRIGLLTLIQRYARMLADLDSSINIYTVNTRATKLNTAATQQTAKAVDNAMVKLQEGYVYTINTGSILDLYKTQDWNNSRSDTLQQLMDAKQQTMAAFLNEIGVKSITEKRERMVSEEVSADNQLLTINVIDMLNQRKEGIKLVNEMFGTAIKVDQMIPQEQKQEQKQEETENATE